jgi:lipoprotein-anchoring transpeptidase ErfK/SrfK
VGAEFKVPNVIPFEIEKALDMPLQPAADPQKPVTAAVEKGSLLKISREGKLIAVMPLASARPGLRGRGSWTILDAIPKPRLTTKRELREAPKTLSTPADGTPPAVAPPLESAQFLNPGPNNPAGILWIQLAKAKSTEPLPYGLHGTSIPGKMKSLEGIGGLRLTNWDIARAVRLMPSGTAFKWLP